MGRFFKTTPKKGMPISTPGFAEGLAKMERCLEKLDIAGGYPDWQNDVLLLVPASVAPAATETETCYVLRKATAADVAANGNLVEGQWLISKRTFAAGTEKSYEATVPHTCPVVTT